MELVAERYKPMLFGRSVTWRKWQKELFGYEKELWVPQPKIDGYRAIVWKIGRDFRLYGRKEETGIKEIQLGYFPEFQPLQEFFRKHPKYPDFIADGELAHQSFPKARGRYNLRNEREIRIRLADEGPCTIALFDLLYLDGRDVRSEALVNRIEMLEQLYERLPRYPLIVLVPVMPAERIAGIVDGPQRLAIKISGFDLVLDLDGGTFKHRSWRYRSGKRSIYWAKSRPYITRYLPIVGRGTRQIYLGVEGNEVPLDMKEHEEAFRVLKSHFDDAKRLGRDIGSLQIEALVKYFPDKDYLGNFRFERLRGFRVAGEPFSISAMKLHDTKP